MRIHRFLPRSGAVLLTSIQHRPFESVEQVGVLLQPSKIPNEFICTSSAQKTLCTYPINSIATILKFQHVFAHSTFDSEDCKVPLNHKPITPAAALLTITATSKQVLEWKSPQANNKNSGSNIRDGAVP